MKRIVVAFGILLMVTWGVANAAQLPLLGFGPPAATPTPAEEPASDAPEAALQRCTPGPVITQPPTMPGDATSVSTPTAEVPTGRAYTGPGERVIVSPGPPAPVDPEELARREKILEGTYLPGPMPPGGGPPLPASPPAPGTESTIGECR